MPRLLRVEYAGACYHVINRGNYRRDLFVEKGAAEAFERTLGEAAVRFGWRVHAYVVMRNHFHLAVQTGEPNLSLGMKWLQGTWARRFNGYRGATGRPFQGRYKSLLVEPGHSLAQVCHYIHLNPLRAKAIGPERLVDYPWSSLEKFTKKRTRPAWLEASTVLENAGELSDDARGWRRYADYLRVRADEDSRTTELNRNHLTRGWCIGSVAFREGVRREFEAKGIQLDLARFSGLEPDQLAAEKRQVWEERLSRLAKEARIDLASLPHKRSAPEKVLLAAAMKLSTSVSNGWLADRLQMGEPATVSQYVRRWIQEPRQKRRTDALLSTIKT